MEILLRRHGDKYYVWKKARWEGGVYHITDENENEYDVDQSNIIAVKNDERVGYVQCQNCGKLIKNDPESIEAHYVEEENSRDCLKCMHMSAHRDKKILDASCTKNADGTYNVTQTYVAKLLCHADYWTKDIDSDEAKRSCVYNRCRRCGVAQINDPFVKYPGLFDTFVTVDALIAKKYIYEQHSRGHFDYDLKCRGTLFACVNEHGIVDHFKLRYRGYTYNLYYSEKHNLLFFDKYQKYEQDVPWGIPDKKIIQVKEKIAALYKEAKK